MSDDFDRIVEGLEQKNIDEFNMGLAIAVLVDSINNPEVYDEEQISGVFEHIQSALDTWKSKYREEILELDK